MDFGPSTIIRETTVRLKGNNMLPVKHPTMFGQNQHRTRRDQPKDSWKIQVASATLFEFNPDRGPDASSQERAQFRTASGSERMLGSTTK